MPSQYPPRYMLEELIASIVSVAHSTRTAKHLRWRACQRRRAAQSCFQVLLDEHEKFPYVMSQRHGGGKKHLTVSATAAASAKVRRRPTSMTTGSHACEQAPAADRPAPMDRVCCAWTTTLQRVRGGPFMREQRMHSCRTPQVVPPVRKCCGQNLPCTPSSYANCHRSAPHFARPRCPTSPPCTPLTCRVQG